MTQCVSDMFRCTAYVGVCCAVGASHASLGHRPRNVCISNLSAESIGSRAAGVEGEIHKVRAHCRITSGSVKRDSLRAVSYPPLARWLRKRSIASRLQRSPARKMGFLGRCPRLLMNAAPLALNTHRSGSPCGKTGSPQDQSVRVADKTPTFRLAAVLTCRCKID
jgi:hypothetical protein